MPLFIIICVILAIIYITVIKQDDDDESYECLSCKDTGEVEVLVMGTDTEMIDCDCQNTTKNKRNQKLKYLLNTLHKL